MASWFDHWVLLLPLEWNSYFPLMDYTTSWYNIFNFLYMFTYINQKGRLVGTDVVMIQLNMESEACNRQH